MYGAQDLARAFATVRANTIQIAQDIPEGQYGFRAAPDTRTVAELLAHIAVAPAWAHRVHGEGISFIDFAHFGESMQRQQRAEAALTTKAGIVEALRRDGDEFAAWLGTMSDQTLAEAVSFPPPIQPSSKTRFEMLLGIKEHEMHHRAQLMVIERMLGIVPHLTRQRQERAAQRAAVQTS
ncbi:MAG: DinB family protein [Vicinamibacterales bacterium]